AISRTLARFTEVPAVAWTAALFAVGIWLLARGSTSLSLTLLLALAIVIIALMLAIVAVTVGHFRLEYLVRARPPARAGSEHYLANTIGIVLMGYFAEAFVVQCAKVVLPREPSGRALIWGSLAGLGGIAVVLTLWVVVMNGSLDPRVLTGETATVITPLAAVVGSGTAALGALLVLFLPGLATLRCMVGAFNVARELAITARFASEATNEVEGVIGEQMIVEATIAAHLVALAEAAGVKPERINAHLRAISRDT